MVTYDPDGKTLTVSLENTNTFAEHIPGERADVCVVKAEDDGRVVGCVLEVRKEPEAVVVSCLGKATVEVNC